MNLEDLYRLLRSEHVQAQGIIDTLDEPLLVLDQTGRVLTGNREFFETFRVARDDTIGRSLFALGAGQWDIPELRRLLGDIIPKSAAIIAYEVKADFPAIGRRTMLVSARRLIHPDNISTSILILFEDVTDRRALATQTTVEGQSGEEYRDAFLGRFEAVMRAEDLALAGSAEDDLSARRYSGTFNDLWDATYGDGSFFAVGRYKTVIQAQPAAPPSIQSLTTSPISSGFGIPGLSGTVETWTCAASGGSAECPLEYGFVAVTPRVPHPSAQPSFSYKNTFTMALNDPGTYEVTAYVRDYDGNVTSKAASVRVW